MKIRQAVKSKIAIFLIMLVLTLPFFAANSLAAIQVNSISGQGMVPDYRLQKDSTHISFTSDANNVRVSENLYTQITCTPLPDNRFDCSFNGPLTTIVKNSQTNTIVLYDVDNGIDPQSATTAAVNIDSLPPKIDSWSVEISPTKDSLILSWDVTDKANSNDNKCAGIKKVEFVDDDSNTVFAEYEFSSYYPDCKIQRSETVQNIVSAGNSDEKRICIVVYDNLYSDSNSERMQHRTKDCKDILIDRKDPLVDCPYKVTKDNEEIKYVSTRGYGSFIEGAEVSINIRENELLRVKSDLSELAENPFYRDAYQNIEWYPGSTSILNCSNQSTSWSCVWSNFHFEPTSSDPVINLKITDNSGQITETSCAAHFEIDNDAPTLLSLGTTKIKDGKSYVNNQTNEIIAKFHESGSGFSRGNVFFSLSSLNPQFDGLTRPYKCTKTSTEEWTCNVYVDVISSDDGAALGISLPNTADDAGNQIVDSSGSVILDITPPQVINVTKSTPCAINGEKLSLKYYVLDLGSGVKSMTVNPSRVSVYPLNVTGDCESKGNDLYKCSADIDYIITQAKTNVPIDVYFEDIAGNINHQVLLQDTCVREGDIVPSFVSVTVKKVTPPKIDRRLASINDLPFMILVSLDFNSHGAKIIRVNDDNCQAIGDYIDFEQAPYLYDEYGKNTTLVVKLKFDEDAIAKEKFDLSCNLTMRIQAGSTVFTKPEIEEVKIQIPFYEWPLGYPDAKAQEKMNAVKKEIRDIDAHIQKLENWKKVLDTLVSIVKMLGAVNSGLQVVKSVIYGVSLALAAVFGIGDALWKASCPVFDFFHGSISKYIWPTGMIPTSLPPLPGYYFKWAATIYECGLCKFDTWLNLGLEALDRWKINSDTKVKASDYDLQAKDMPQFKQKMDKLTDRIELGRYYNEKKSSGYLAGTTLLTNEVDATGWLYDPYKSIHYSNWCACLPGIVYNHKKLKQINCRYLTCLQDHSKKGLPIDNCDVMEKEMECLYWDSAQYKIHGTFGAFIDNLIKLILKNSPGIIISATYILVCNNYYHYGTDAKNCKSLPEGFMSTMCGLTGAALGIMELKETFSGGWTDSWKTYDDKVDQNDLCQGVDYSE